MRQYAHIRIERCLSPFRSRCSSFIINNHMPQLAAHSPPGFLSEQFEMRKGNIAKKVYPFTISPYFNLVRMEFKLQSIAQKFAYREQQFLQSIGIVPHDHKIIRISGVVFNMQCMFHKLIELVHIHVSEKLARQVSNRQSFSRCISTLSLSLSLANPPPRSFR